MGLQLKNQHPVEKVPAVLSSWVLFWSLVSLPLPLEGGAVPSCPGSGYPYSSLQGKFEYLRKVLQLFSAFDHPSCKFCEFLENCTCFLERCEFRACHHLVQVHTSMMFAQCIRSGIPIDVHAGHARRDSLLSIRSGAARLEWNFFHGLETCGSHLLDGVAMLHSWFSLAACMLHEDLQHMEIFLLLRDMHLQFRTE